MSISDAMSAALVGADVAAQKVQAVIESTNMKARVVCRSTTSADRGKTVTLQDANDSTNTQTKTFDANLKLDFTVPGRTRYNVIVKSGNTVQSTTQIDVDYGEYKEIQIGLDKTTWTGVQTIINAGLAGSMLAIGDSITANLSTGEDIIFEIAAINLERDGQVIWKAKNAMNALRQHHTSNTNAGGWNSSDLRTYLNNTVYAALPAELKPLIAERAVKASQGSQSAAIQTANDKIFLPREFEVFGATTYAAASEQSQGGALQWPIFATAAKRIITQGLGGAACIWWLVSPYASGSAHFCYVGTSGAPGHYDASTSYGVVPCFQMIAQ